MLKVYLGARTTTDVSDSRGGTASPFDRRAVAKARSAATTSANRTKRRTRNILTFTADGISTPTYSRGELCGGFLFLRPTGARTLFRNLTTAGGGQRLQFAFAANQAPLAAHFGHDLRDDRPG